MYKITIYTKTGCNECQALIQYLVSNEVQFIEKNIEVNHRFAKDLANLASGIERLPVIVVDKAKERSEHPQKEIIVGFDRQRISELVEQEW